ncbi:MAG: YncE family protein, partial [Nitrosomonadales bacterium]|nr:YncE family protein [Nitrosomonadales bacterium]
FTVTSRIPAGFHPFGISISPDGQHLYVVNVYEDTVSAIHLATGKSEKIKVGIRPYCAAISPDSKTIFVTNTQDDSVSVIDATSNQVIATIDVGGFPEGIDFDAATQRVYVASWSDDSVTVIDAKTHKVINTISTGQQSRAFGRFILN